MDVMGKELQTIRSMLAEDYPEMSDGDIRKASMKLIKLRWKKEDNEWHLRSGLAAEMPIEDFYRLQKVKSSLPDEPDLTTQEHYAVASFKRLPHQFSLIGNVEIVEEISSPSLSSIITGKESTLKNDRPNDYILMKSTLCTSLPFVNANGDAFEAADLIDAVESGQLDKLQPAIVDWRHDFQSYGNTIGAEIVEKTLDIEGFGKNKVKQVVVYSVFYAWLHNYKAKKIRDWAKKGVLTFSMACGAEAQEYKNGGAVRVLRKPHFVANSIIPPDIDPADENATLVEMAGRSDNDIPVVYASYNEYPQSVREKLTLAWADMTDKNPDEENNIGVDMDKMKELETQVAQLTQALQEANDKLVNYEQSELAERNSSLEEELSGVIGERDSLADELESVKQEMEAAKAEAETAKAEAETAKADLTSAVDEIKEMRTKEVIEINNTRKEKLEAIFGEGEENEEKVNHWLAQCSASLDDNGKVVDNQESFDNIISNFPKAKDAEPEIKDVPPTDKVTRSQETIVASKTNDDTKPKKVFEKTM